MTTMAKALGIAGTTLRRTLSDRTGAIFIFVVPFVIIIVVGLFTGVFSTISVGLLRGDSALSDHVLSELSGPHVEVRQYRNELALDAAVRQSVVSVGVTSSGTVEKLAQSGQPIKVTLLIDPARPYPAAAVGAVQAALQRAGVVLGSASFATREVGAPFSEALKRAESVSHGHFVVTSQSLTAAGPGVLGFQYTAPTNLVLFVFINTLVTASGFIESTRIGATRRMLVTPTPRWALVGGEWLGRLAVALFQAAVIVVVSALVFNVNWGQPGGAALVVVLTAALSASACLALATVLRSEQQAIALGPPIGIVLGMLGGCMWPLAAVGNTLRVVGHVSPLAWSVDALVGLGDNTISTGAFWRDVGVLALFIVVIGGAAVYRLKTRFS